MKRRIAFAAAVAGLCIQSSAFAGKAEADLRRAIAEAGRYREEGTRTEEDLEQSTRHVLKAYDELKNR